MQKVELGIYLDQLTRQHSVTFAPSFRSALDLADQTAQRLKHDCIGTEHLLVGLVGVEPTYNILNSLGLNYNRVKDAIEHIRGEDRSIERGWGLTQRAIRAIDLSIDAAKVLGTPGVAAEHMLLGICIEGNGIGVGILESFHRPTDRVINRTLSVIQGLSLERIGGESRWVDSLTQLRVILDNEGTKPLVKAQIEASLRGLVDDAVGVTGNNRT